MIEITNLTKRFTGGRLIHQGINLSLPAGKMTVIIGKSGEGKSLLLKQIVGLIKPTSGQILINQTDIIQANSTERTAVLRKCGYVFQFAALLDSLDIFQNIGITLLEAGKTRAEVLPLVKQVLKSVNLPEHVLDKYPSELSGGMLKRAGLARTLLTNPEIIFYDEPTSGLDPITTRIIHELMASLQQQRQLTSVVISHDLDIFNYADYVVLLAHGRVQFFGEAKTIWQSDNPYIYQFIRGLTAGPLQNDVSQTA